MERRRTEQLIPEAQKAEYARAMRKRGRTFKAIGARIGMSGNGAMQMLRRLDEPRYYGPQEDGDRPEGAVVMDPTGNDPFDLDAMLADWERLMNEILEHQHDAIDALCAAIEAEPYPFPDL
jgi:hypothetical protein